MFPEKNTINFLKKLISHSSCVLICFEICLLIGVRPSFQPRLYAILELERQSNI